ncbi:Hypothetical predicted protein [Pelobates cultripes]|uniref:Uncharacterized protein n=1 Tax=Pelobates cultripes TaxID=61616 RepID=A0AAD1T4I5_PELCU|nr:Hypothetical predicted protein [Pelobates cultripes]
MSDNLSEPEQEEALSKSDDEDSYDSGAYYPNNDSLSGPGADPKVKVDLGSLADPEVTPMVDGFMSRRKPPSWFHTSPHRFLTCSIRGLQVFHKVPLSDHAGVAVLRI